MKRYLWVGLLAAALVLILAGLGRGEWDEVLRQANTLCTACIGLSGGH